jgi:hypothetical protein
MRASLAAAAVCSLTVDSLKRRSIGSRRDLDELHAAVGDHREPAHHDTPRHDEVLVALLVAPGPVPVADEPRGERPASTTNATLMMQATAPRVPAKIAPTTTATTTVSAASSNRRILHKPAEGWLHGSSGSWVMRKNLTTAARRQSVVAMPPSTGMTAPVRKAPAREER